MSVRTPKPIKTAQRVLYGLCPLADILGIDHEEGALWTEWLFSPEDILAELRAGSLLAAVPGARVSQNGEPFRRQRRALAEAAGEALQVLAELAEGGLVHSPRLRARLCLAAREELAALVAEWQAVRVSPIHTKVTA